MNSRASTIDARYCKTRTSSSGLPTRAHMQSAEAVTKGPERLDEWSVRQRAKGRTPFGLQLLLEITASAELHHDVHSHSLEIVVLE